MLGATLGIPQYIARLHAEIDRVDQQEIQAWADLVYEAWENERFIFVFGNGGSGTTATHHPCVSHRSMISASADSDDSGGDSGKKMSGCRSRSSSPNPRAVLPASHPASRPITSISLIG